MSPFKKIIKSIRVVHTTAQFLLQHVASIGNPQKCKCFKTIIAAIF